MPMRICLRSSRCGRSMLRRMDYSQHRHPDRRRRFGRKRARDLPRARRAVGGAPGRGCGDARGVSRAIRRWSTPSTTRGGRGSATVEPNAAHEALARLDAEWPGELLLVTQNVDDLHERAGSKRLIHMHGELTSGWCLACDERFAWDGPMGEGAACPACEASGQVRPDIVWFGEMPYDMERIDDALRAATCSSRSARRARSIRRRASSRPRATAARGRSRSTSSRARAACFSMKAGSGKAGELVPGGWRRCSA